MTEFKITDLLIWRSPIAMTGCTIFFAIAWLAGNLADVIPNPDAQRDSLVFNLAMGGACAISVALTMLAKKKRKLKKQNQAL